MLLFAAAIGVLPGVWWPGGSQGAEQLKSAGIRRVYVPSAAAWKADGLEIVPISEQERRQYQNVPKPGTRFEITLASATREPWVDSNSWRFERGVTKAFYNDLPPGSAPLAAAEAYAYGVEAILHAAPSDLPALGRMLTFLERLDRPRLPSLVNIGVIDNGSPALDEVLNLLGRRNLLYRVT